MKIQISVCGVVRHVVESVAGMSPLATKEDFQRLEAMLMDALEKLDALNTAFEDMKTRVLAGIDDLRRQIAEGASGSPELLDGLDRLQTDVENFNPIPEVSPPSL